MNFITYKGFEITEDQIEQLERFHQREQPPTYITEIRFDSNNLYVKDNLNCSLDIALDTFTPEFAIKRVFRDTFHQTLQLVCDTEVHRSRTSHSAIINRQDVDITTGSLLLVIGKGANDFYVFVNCPCVPSVRDSLTFTEIEPNIFHRDYLGSLDRSLKKYIQTNRKRRIVHKDVLIEDSVVGLETQVDFLTSVLNKLSGVSAADKKTLTRFMDQSRLNSVRLEDAIREKKKIHQVVLQYFRSRKSVKVLDRYGK